MSDLKQQLIDKLNALPDVRVGLWKDSQLLCVFYKEKDVAHFQNDEELDIRLTRSLIKREGLVPTDGSMSHPNRSKNSRWIVLPIKQPTDVDQLVRLVQLATELV